MKKLILIDSHAIIHRAFHALPPLNTPAGEPSNAVYGFTTILLRILRELKPDYIAAAFDMPGPTFRHAAYERYKAQRPETPSELAGQFAKVKEVLEAFQIPVFYKEGYEADDIIGTIAKNTEKNKDLEVVVVTGDMDALQLVRPGLSVCNMKNQSEEAKYYDPEAVKEKYGLDPDQIIDFKGLRGDTSDNIPGVRGIGEVTAVALLQKFGSIEGIYRALAKKTKDVSSSVAKKLLAGEEDAKFSRELARMKTDVSIKFVLAETSWQEAGKKESLSAIFQKFGFNSLLKKINSHTFANTSREGAGINGEESVKKPAQASLLDFGGMNSTAETKETKREGFSEDQKNILSEFLMKEVETPLTGILREMEARGVLLDIDFLKSLSLRINKKINKLKQEIYDFAGEDFNINSTRELSRIIFEKLKISTLGLRKTEKSGVISTGASELEKLKDLHPIIQKILAYRELNKLKSTYIDTLPKLLDKKDGRIHTTFDQFGASTGRLSSANPNLQNIPIMSEEGREIRKAFVAPRGFAFVSFDYSQIELRVAAHIADDQKMIEAFKSGKDIHKLTAAEVYNLPLDKVTPDLRRAAKTLNFGVLYGMGPQAFSEATGFSRTEAKKFIDEYFKKFSGIRKFLDETKRFAHEHGYVETIFGRRRYIPEISSVAWRFRRDAERMAINMPIQGTATGDIVKMAMVKLTKWLKKNKLEASVRILLQVHDELVFEIKKDILSDVVPQIRDIMENVTKLKVPLEVEVKAGPNWGEQTALDF